MGGVGPGGGRLGRSINFYSDASCRCSCAVNICESFIFGMELLRNRVYDTTGRERYGDDTENFVLRTFVDPGVYVCIFMFAV